MRFERHAALFAWLVTSGLGVPPGEDLLVAGTGALVAAGDLTWPLALPLAIAAVVTSDVLLFLGGCVARSSLTRGSMPIPDRITRQFDRLTGRWEGLAIAVARLVPGMRTPVFVTVGARGVSRARFLLIDACAATVWVPVVMTFGAAILSRVFGDRSPALEVLR
jgi:membrane protein DedA with SNARE-associated domain